MKEKKEVSFSLLKRIQSFRFAFQGIRSLWQEEHNFRIHLVVACLFTVFGLLVGFQLSDWMWFALTVALVLITEGINTALEMMCDFVEPNKHPKIKQIKDVAAAVVLIASMFAVFVGFILVRKFLF